MTGAEYMQIAKETGLIDFLISTSEFTHSYIIKTTAIKIVEAAWHRDEKRFSDTPRGTVTNTYCESYHAIRLAGNKWFQKNQVTGSYEIVEEPTIEPEYDNKGFNRNRNYLLNPNWSHGDIPAGLLLLKIG